MAPMRTAVFSAGLPRQFPRGNRVATLPQLKEFLCMEADITVFRKLKELSYRTSYSHRGSCYTLDENVAFDERGLWSCDSVWFSRHGAQVATAEVCVTQCGERALPPGKREPVRTAGALASSSPRSGPFYGSTLLAAARCELVTLVTPPMLA